MMKTGVDFSALPQTRLCDPAGYVKPSTGDKGYKTDSTSRCIGERPLPGIVNVKAFEGCKMVAQICFGLLSFVSRTVENLRELVISLSVASDVTDESPVRLNSEQELTG